MALFFIIMVMQTLSSTFATGDFRHISYEDLIEKSSLFTSEGVTTYSQLLFDVARQQVIVGARDNLYRLTLTTLTPLEHAVWPAPADKITTCQDKGQTPQNCRNYIKVLLTNGKSLFTCGTNAFSPLCTWREIENINNVTSRVSGVAMAPHSPASNVTALLARSNGGLFSGTPLDFSSTDAAIYRTLASPNLRTQQYDSRWLNDPQFVGSFETKDHVYFLFREIAVEYINCGKKIYSRIARVCKKDPGGKPMLKDVWMSFSKARLNCSQPGEFPFYYDEIQGAAYSPDEGIVYATFTTPSNAIAGSAICAFNMTSIESSFNGPFKHQEHSGAAWEKKRVPNQYRQHCDVPVEQHQVMDNKKYQLMDEAVQGTKIGPLYSTTMERFTHIAIDKTSTKFHQTITILYVATAEGLIKKLSLLSKTQVTCVVEVWGPLPSPAMILQFLKDSQSLYVGMENGLLRIPAAQCHRHRNRQACLNAQEPYCGWNEHMMKCEMAPNQNHQANHWQQEIKSCPVLTDPVDGGWSAWSTWAPCQHGTGEIANGYGRSHSRQNSDNTEDFDTCQCQTRVCNNPPPENGGSTCTGPKIKVSNCTIHGDWSQWSSWSGCSQTCGFAMKTRSRTCTNPAPAYGGRVCVGHDHDEIICIGLPPCPLTKQLSASSTTTTTTTTTTSIQTSGRWSSWGPWNSCSRPCNGGIRLRERTCDKSSSYSNDNDCPGCNFQIEHCNTQPCSESRKFSAWTPWFITTNSLNTSQNNFGYIEKRYRYSCKEQTEDPSNIKIDLVKEEERFCRNDGSCTRGNVNKKVIDNDMVNSDSGCNIQACKNALKKNDNSWSCWSDWSLCDDETGQQYRTRNCLQSQGFGCHGVNKEIRDCLSKCNDEEIMSNALPRRGEIVGASMGAVVAGCLVGFLMGLAMCSLAAFLYMKRKKPTVPGSPHYISKQNPYVAVPLKEVNTKRQPSFSGSSHGNGTLRTKINPNVNGLGSPKLYPKALDYESATLKRNSHGQQHIRADLDQEKYY
ncbi:semaphorin-5A isoform X2 [Aphidius gifuensis]|uniref:semaphorin-5A isoform X2 n=1 Tax=Aphidius gifuensis TaxID=684658 RepID=UPI001CDB92EB|nr:semaphorin-5A isoform X2 [Aphidius gifuensis]